MRWRGPAVMAALLAVGVGGGFGASLAADRQPVASGVPTPVAAQSPSYPVDPEPEYLPDADVPPLPVDLPMVEARLGTEGFTHAFPVPEGWVPTAINSVTTKWSDPANPPLTYFLRVEQVDNDNRTVARTLEDRVQELDEVEPDFELLGSTADSLTFSYTVNDRLRIGILRWLRPSSSPFAEVEVAVTGRQVDREGMAALVAEIAAGLRRA